MIPKRVTEAVERKHARQDEERTRRIEERKGNAFAEVKQLVAEFRRIDSNLGRIVLFGSLAEDTVRNEDFDIDLSFEGVEYYKCVAVTLNSAFKIDLVDYRVCRDHIKEAIDSKGIVVYDPGP